MSGEHFVTQLMTMVSTRWGQLPCYIHADSAMQECQRAIMDQPMGGISGDMPERREWVASLLGVLSQMVKALAHDAAFDNTLSDEKWSELVALLREEATDGR